MATAQSKDTDTTDMSNMYPAHAAHVFAQVFRDNNALYQCTWIWFTIAGVTAALRFYTRTQLVKKFGWDDFTMMLGMAAYTAFSIILLIMRHWAQFQEEYPTISYGSDYELNQQSFDLWFYSANLWQVQSLLYIAGIASTRISVALLYLRVIPSGTRPWARRTSLCMIGVTAVSSIAAGLLDLFECIPVGVPRDQARCIDSRILPMSIVIYSIVSLVVDFTLTFLPIGVLWTMQMKRNKKIGTVIFTSGMGLMASGTIVWRLFMILNQDFVGIQKDQDSNPYWYMAEPVLRLKVNMMLSWTIEQSVSIAASSFATYKPFFMWLREKVECPFRRYCPSIFRSRRPPSITIPPLTPVPLGSPTSPNMPGDNAYTRRIAEYQHVHQYELSSRGTHSSEKNWPSSGDEESPMSPGIPALARGNSTQALIGPNASLTPTSPRFGDDSCVETPQPSPTPTAMYERDVVPSLPTISSGQVLSLSHSQSQSTIQSIPMDYSELFYGMPATLTEAKIRESSTQGSDNRSNR